MERLTGVALGLFDGGGGSGGGGGSWAQAPLPQVVFGDTLSRECPEQPSWAPSQKNGSSDQATLQFLRYFATLCGMFRRTL